MDQKDLICRDRDHWLLTGQDALIRIVAVSISFLATKDIEKQPGNKTPFQIQYLQFVCFAPQFKRRIDTATMNLSLQRTPAVLRDDEVSELPQSIVIAVVVMTVIFLVGGTLGNALVCLVLSRRHDLRKVPHFLFANLTIIGLISSLFLMPMIISITAKTYLIKQRESMDIMCKIRLFFSFFCSAINALSLSLMAIDRQDCVFRPLRRRIQKHNVKKVLLAVWCAVIIVSISFAITLATDDSQCPASDPFNLNSSFSNSSMLFSVYITAFGTGFNVSTILIIIITFLRIVKRLRSCPLPESRSIYVRYESHITKLTYKTCAIFVLSWFPVIMSHSFARFNGDANIEVMRSVKLITLAFTNLTYVANPFLHYKLLKISPEKQQRTNLVAMRRIGSLDINTTRYASW